MGVRRALRRRGRALFVSATAQASGWRLAGILVPIGCTLWSISLVVVGILVLMAVP